MAIKVLIADDHSLVRQGLRRYLEMAGDIHVVGEASNGNEVLSLMDNGSGDAGRGPARHPDAGDGRPGSRPPESGSSTPTSG